MIGRDSLLLRTGVQFQIILSPPFHSADGVKVVNVGKRFRIGRLEVNEQNLAAAANRVQVRHSSTVNRATSCTASVTDYSK